MRTNKELESGQLVELLPEQPHAATPIYMYYQKHRFVQPKVRHFIRMIMDGGDF